MAVRVVDDPVSLSMILGGHRVLVYVDAQDGKLALIIIP